MTGGRPHWYTRRDRNQCEIVEGLRALSFCVLDVSQLGGAALDLFVGGWSMRLGCYAWVQVEVKVSSGQLTKGEQEHLTKWSELPIIVARSIEDVVEWFRE